MDVRLKELPESTISTQVSQSQRIWSAAAPSCFLKNWFLSRSNDVSYGLNTSCSFRGTQIPLRNLILKLRVNASTCTCGIEAKTADATVFPPESTSHLKTVPGSTYQLLRLLFIFLSWIALNMDCMASWLSGFVVRLPPCNAMFCNKICVSMTWWHSFDVE